MIEKLTKKYIDALVKLRESAFNDSKDEISEFYEKAASFEDTYIYVKNEKVISTATVIPVSVTNDKALKGGYVYAVATDNEYKNSGYATKILEYIGNLDFDFLFLHPASESLFSFYEKRGYTQKMFLPEFKDIFKKRECSLKEYMSLRNVYLENYEHIIIPESKKAYDIENSIAYITEKGICLEKNGKITEYLENTPLELNVCACLARSEKKLNFKEIYFNTFLI